MTLNEQIKEFNATATTPVKKYYGSSYTPAGPTRIDELWWSIKTVKGCIRDRRFSPSSKKFLRLKLDELKSYSTKPEVIEFLKKYPPDNHIRDINGLMERMTKVGLILGNYKENA